MVLAQWNDLRQEAKSVWWMLDDRPTWREHQPGVMYAAGLERCLTGLCMCVVMNPLAWTCAGVNPTK